MQHRIRTSLSKDLVPKGLVVSAILHVGAVLLLANHWLPDSTPSAELSGSPRTISLEAAFVERDDLGLAIEMAPIQIQPGVAWVAERRFVDRPTVAEDWDLPAITIAEPSELPQLAVRSNRREPIPTAVDQPVSMPRTTATPEPEVDKHVPKPAGVEAKTPPLFFDNKPGRYPDLAKQRGWEGDVLLKLVIDATGRITEVSVARSSGHEILDAAAVNAVRRWRAKPARRFGRPVSTTEYLPVQFRL